MLGGGPKPPLFGRHLEDAFNGSPSLIDVGGDHPEYAVAVRFIWSIAAGRGYQGWRSCCDGRALTPEYLRRVRPVAPEAAAPGKQLEQDEHERSDGGYLGLMDPCGKADRHAAEDVQGVTGILDIDPEANGRHDPREAEREGETALHDDQDRR